MPEEQNWRITHYCSACNDPKGSQLGNKNNKLNLGECAIHNSHGLNGKVIQIAGMTLRVADHCGKTKTVDIWQGVKGSCKCNYLGYGTIKY